MLEAAHKGYQFQDLVTAIYLSEAILNSEITITVDVKSSEDDRFDDLKIESNSRLDLIQIKRSESTEFDISLLSSDQRGLRLDRLFTSWKSENQRGGTPIVDCMVLSNWTKPSRIPMWLRPVQRSINELPTRGLCFQIDLAECSKGERERLCRHLSGEPQQDLDQFLAQLIIVLEVPEASLDLDQAGELESSLLNTLKDRIGVGVQPNDHISPIDAASRLIHRATILRSSSPESSSILGKQIVPILGLVTDFGALPQDFPFVENEFQGAAKRKDTFERLVVFGRVSVLRAGPGAGKSWELTNHFKSLENQGVKVARHYCFISPIDESKERRITRKTLLGNLISEIKPILPEDVATDLPQYAATEEVFQRVLELIPNTNRLVILVDGLDHILRVRPLARNLSQQETDIVDLISSLKLPSNVSVVVGSQPGSYLDKLAGKTLTLDLPAWEESDCTMFLQKRLKMSHDEGGDWKKVYSLYFKQTQGNPLFCNYLVRQIAQTEPTDWSEVLNILSAQPPFSGELKNYYSYVFGHIPTEGKIILRRLGILDFGVTVEELGEMSPIVKSFVNETLKVALPVLSPSNNSNGIRIYHESFRRFILEELDEVSAAEWSEVAGWLKQRGFFKSFRSFLYLFPYLQRANRAKDILNCVNERFVTLGVAAGFASELIKRNLDLWLGVAAEYRDYGRLGLGSELQNALSSFDFHLYDYTEYAKAASCIVGSNRFGERMVFEGMPVYTQEDGMKICAVLHSLGGFSPWATYFSSQAQSREHKVSGDDLEVSKARFLGRIVLKGINAASARLSDYLNQLTQEAEVDCRFIEDIFSILHREGGSLAKLRKSIDVRRLPEQVKSSLLLVEARSTESEKIRDAKYYEVLERSTDPWQKIEALDHVPNFEASSQVLEDFVIKTRNLLSDERPEQQQVESWLFELRAVAKSHRELVEAQRSFITGDWWYRNWLRFVMDFTLCESISEIFPSEKALQFLQILIRSTEPFLGKPRACDLYAIRECIHWTIKRCLVATATDKKYLREALILLREMSFKTTTYLQSSAGGPLIPAVLFEICLELSEDAEIRSIVSEEMKPLVSRIEMGSTYPQIAQEKLKVTTLAYQLGLHEEAKATWEEATRYLTAYGERKDATLEEILAPTLILHEADSIGSYERLRRCQSLAYTVYQHTDGKGTGHLITQWFSYLASMFPRSAGEILATSHISDGGAYDYRIEEGLSRVLESIETSDRHLLLLAILIIQGGLSEALESRLELIQSEVDNLSKCFSHLITAKVQGDTYIANGGTLRSLVGRGQLFAYSETWVPNTVEAVKNEVVARALDKVKPVFSESGRTEVVNFKSELKEQLSNYKVEKDELIDASKSVMQQLCNSIAVAEDLLEWLRDDLDRSESSDFMEILGDITEECGWTDLAAKAFALAFCRFRGSGGWLAFGDSTKHTVLKKSFELKSSIAETVFIDEIVRQNGSWGLTQHVIGGLVSLGRFDEARQVWEEAFKVIAWRLPNKAIAGPFDDLPKMETAKSSKEVLILIIFARLSNPEDKRRKSALMAAAWCIQNRSTLVGKLLAEICRTDLRVDVLITILRLVECYERSPWEITEIGKDVLSRICREGDFLPAKIAFVLLERADLPAPTQVPTDSKVVSLVGQLDRRMLELDANGVLSQAEEVWPEITEEVMFEVQLAFQEGGDDRARWKSLMQMSHDSSYKKIPAAGVIDWPEVVFSRIVNRKLRGLREKLWLTGNLHSQLESRLAHSLSPDLVTPVKYQLSRIPRPDIPLPDKVENKVDEINLSGGETSGDWIEIGCMEYFHVPSGEGFEKISRTVLAVSGLVQLPQNEEMPKGAVPLSRAGDGDWERDCVHSGLCDNAYGPLAAIIRATPDSLGNQILGLAPGLRQMFDLRPTENDEPMGYKTERGELKVIFRWWNCQPVGGRDGVVEEYSRIQGGSLMMCREYFEGFQKRQTGKFLRITANQELS